MVEVLRKMSLQGKGWVESTEAKGFSLFIANLTLGEQ